jgi:hypothetical protein
MSDACSLVKHQFLGKERPHCGREANGNFWPGPEILAINSVAESQPFDSTCHEKLRGNRHGRLMAEIVNSPFQNADAQSGRTASLPRKFHNRAMAT